MLYVHPSFRILLPDTYSVFCFLRSDTDFCIMYTRSGRFLPSDTYFVVFLRSDTDFCLIYTRSDSLAFRQQISLFCYFLIQILVTCTHVLLEFCVQTSISLFSCGLTQIFVLCTHVLQDFCLRTHTLRCFHAF